MFLQIALALSKLVSILNNGQKLVDGKKRKKIGSDLVEIHLIISRIVDGADSIENTLVEIIEYSNGINNLSEYLTPEEIFNYYIITLEKLLKEQKFELNRLVKLLDENKALFEVYSGMLFFTDLINFKASLVDVINEFVLRDRTVDALFVPKTFNLMEVPSVKNNQFRDYQSIFFNTIRDQELIDEFTLRIATDINEGKEVLFLHSTYLLNQIRHLHIKQQLLESKKELSDLIKSNFKVEELF